MNPCRYLRSFAIYFERNSCLKFIMIDAFDALSRLFSEPSLTLCVNRDSRWAGIDRPAPLTRSDQMSDNHFYSALRMRRSRVN
jgi:hypothetical protein